MIPPVLAGQDVVVVAGGPSLRGFDFTRLRGLNVVAVNKALYDCPDALVLWWSDVGFWRRHRGAIMQHSALYKATCQAEYKPVDLLDPHVHVYNFTGLPGWDDHPTCLRHGNNSTYAAMQVAAKAGPPRRLVVLGLDMQHGPDGATHYHDGHGFLHEERTLVDLMLPYFKGLRDPLERLGIEVRNGSPNSRVDTWPRMTIDQALEGIR